MTIQTQESTERREAYDDEFRPRIRPWWVPWLVALAVAAIVIGVGSYFAYGRDAGVASMAMGGAGHGVPAVTGYYDGEEILFIHTEASDPKVAKMLTDMMNSPVIVVPGLRQVPEPVLGDVFVFANGVEPDDRDKRGPFGFQPDVFDTVPGDSRYSPLRAISVVTWKDGSTARALRSVEEIESAAAAGELRIEQPEVVVNMPVVDWPGGER